MFGSCFTDIFFKFLSLLIPEWRQFKWFKLNWHVINQGWFLSLFKGFVKYMYGIWTKLCSYYKIQHLFYWALWVYPILAFRFSVNIFTVCFCTCTCRFSCTQMMFIYMYRVYIFILLFTLILQLPWRKLRSFKELSSLLHIPLYVSIYLKLKIHYLICFSVYIFGTVLILLLLVVDVLFLMFYFSQLYLL